MASAFTLITSLPLRGYANPNYVGFVPTLAQASPLLPAPAGQVLAAHQRQADAQDAQGRALAQLFPAPLGSGRWWDFKRRRQQIKRAFLLTEMGLPEAGTPYFF